MEQTAITVESIKERRAADKRKPCRLPTWEEIDYLLWLLDQEDTPEVCCSWGCGTGACETCPCCCAGWCIGGRDGIPGTPECEPDAPADQVAYFWEVAILHNPIAVEVARLRRIVGLADPAAVDRLASALAKPINAGPLCEQRICGGSGWYGSRWHDPENHSPHLHCPCGAPCDACASGDGLNRSKP